MLDKLLWVWDWFMVGVVYLVLRLRWAYFHIHPSYMKFRMTETENHFQHKSTGRIHSDVIIELKNGRKL
jgi:hypothetical protein